MALVRGRENRPWKQMRCEVIPKLFIYTYFIAFGNPFDTLYKCKTSLKWCFRKALSPITEGLKMLEALNL